MLRRTGWSQEVVLFVVVLMVEIICLYPGVNYLIERQKWTQAKEGTLLESYSWRGERGCLSGTVSLNRKTKNIRTNEGLKLQMTCESSCLIVSFFPEIIKVTSWNDWGGRKLYDSCVDISKRKFILQLSFGVTHSSIL